MPTVVEYIKVQVIGCDVILYFEFLSPPNIVMNDASIILTIAMFTNKDYDKMNN